MAQPPLHTANGTTSLGVALITGAAQGIGRAIALRLASDGFDIGLNDLVSNEHLVKGLAQEIEQNSGRKTSVVLCDVTEDLNVKSMVAKVVENLGGLDVMVANAGIVSIKPFLEVEVEDWDRVMAVNARAVFSCYRYAAEQMVKQGRGGRIIGASSGYGKRAGALAAAYSASKFAVRGLTQSAADELGPHGITVNAYAPGYIVSPMTEGIIVPQFPNPGDFLAEAQKASLLGYNGSPEDVAGLVSYIASKESRFVTGQTLSINGGYFFD